MEIFDAVEHITVSGGVLLDNVLDVVRLERLPQLASCDEELDLTQRSDGVLVNWRQLRQRVRLVLLVVYIARMYYWSLGWFGGLA